MQTLDQSKTYYRRITVLDMVTLMMIISFMFFANGFLLSLLLIVVYPFSHSKVLVSIVGDKNTKVWVRKIDWDYYCKERGIGPVMQYKSRSMVLIKQA